ncbi:2-octaprenyl-6-methoxyphenyl hydroxylase [filamentous cyanobacterium CCP5]|nr:2-octaprenyl-6-methoxyphenyl hydroxylase [filamentous cyanobacterium CCP5]
MASSTVRSTQSAATPESPQRLKVDVAIVGGGIVGLTLAAALRDTPISVAVIEAQTPQQAASRQRAYAFSLTSADIFRGLGLWEAIAPRIVPFSQVRLSDGDFGQAVVFRPKDIGRSAVYYSAEHSVLMEALQQAVCTCPRIHFLSPAQMDSSSRHPDQTDLTVQTADGERLLSATLVVAADGQRSPLRQQAQIDTFGWKYWQSCITTVVEPEYDHGRIAYERFWPSGPFAILPLPDGRCQIVWTAPHGEAKALMALPEDEFLAQLQDRYGSQMGRLQMLSQPLMFPVQLMQSSRYVQPSLALIGDAAHACHPVGGQGLNMGIRDAAALAEVLIAARERGEPLNGAAVLKRYERWRRLENWVILSFTDLLNRSFSNQILPMVGLRRLGIVLLQKVQPLKHLALRLMTGQLGRVPKIARSE